MIDEIKITVILRMRKVGQKLSRVYSLMQQTDFLLPLF